MSFAMKNKSFRSLTVLACCGASVCLQAQATARLPWDTDALYTKPAVYDIRTEPFSAMKNDPVKPIMYDGEPYKGKPTRVFAWIGFPKGASEASPVPAMVLVHGGGGTAFRKWVKLWNDRGYAAIAMDTCGHVPLPLDRDGQPWPKHDWSGPAGWGDFLNVHLDVKEQWTYHAVAAVIRGHSLLRSYPQVDASRIGLTGISWGGYLTNIVAGVDSRFRFAVPVYGCGFLGEDSAWSNGLKHTKHSKAYEAWFKLWDPSVYLGNAAMPMLFCNGTNDQFYRTRSWDKTTALPKGDVVRCYKIRMPHGHAPSGDPKEIRVFADAMCKGGEPLPSLSGFKRDGMTLTAKVASPVERIKESCVAFTLDKGTSWEKCFWQSQPAAFDARTGVVTAQLPETVRAAYLYVRDHRGMLVSTPVAFYPN